MKPIKIATVFLTLLFCVNVKAQYFAPLQLGNTWTKGYYSQLNLYEKWKYTDVDTNIKIGEKTYHQIQSGGGGSTFLRLDTNGIYYRYVAPGWYSYPNNELAYYKKNMTVGDTICTMTSNGWASLFYSEAEGVTNQWNRQVAIKWIGHSVPLGGGIFFWTEEFGLLHEIASESGAGDWIDLMGCVINGVLYGDTSTTLVGVEPLRKNETFALAQNYPNPFNPGTTINYQLPKAGLVKLRVYDLLGRQVAELVNQQKEAGRYAVEFNGANLASGMYVYRLECGGFTATKKLTLLK